MIQHGTPARVVLDTIAIPLEASLRDVPGVEHVHSLTQADRCLIGLELASSADRQRLRMALGDRTAAFVAPLQQKNGGPEASILPDVDATFVCLAIASDQYDMLSLSDMSRRLIIPRLRRIPGVAEIDILDVSSGPEGFVIFLDAKKLDSHGLSAEDILKTIQVASGKIPEQLGSLLNLPLDLAITARRPSWPERSWRWCRHNPSVAALATGLLAAVVAGFGGVLWQWSQAERARQSESFAHAEADARAGEVQAGLARLQAASALVDRTRVFWQWRRGDDALTALNEAIALRPDLGPAWAERGRLYSDLGLWELAVADERRAFELNEPSQTTQWWSHAVLLAQVGDVEGYHRVCKRMQERFSGHHASFMLEMVRTICVIPSAETDYSRVVQRVQTASLDLPQDSVTLYVLGLAHYRAGQFRDAVQRCTESQNSSGVAANQLPNSPVLALAYDQLGEPDKARASMELATQTRNHWIEQLYTGGETGWGTHRGASANWPVPPSVWLEFDALYREARVHLGDNETTADPRLAVLRARAFAAIGRYSEANAEYLSALAVSPRADRICMEQHRNQAFRFLHEADFAGAAKEFAEATKLDASDAGLWLALAEAHLAAGNLAAYRRACGEMLERFANTRDPWIADKVVWTCVNRPDSLSDMTDLAPLATVATASYSGATRIEGAMWVRAGRYEDAIRAFQDASNYHTPNPWDWCFRAIAHHHLGHVNESRQCLEHAARWIEQADQRKMPDIEVTKPCWRNLSWYERAGSLRLFDETRVLITSQRPGP